MHHAGNELHEMQRCMLNGTRPFEQMVMHNNNLKIQLCLIIYCIHVSAWFQVFIRSPVDSIINRLSCMSLISLHVCLSQSAARVVCDRARLPSALRDTIFYQKSLRWFANRCESCSSDFFFLLFQPNAKTNPFSFHGKLIYHVRLTLYDKR